MPLYINRLEAALKQKAAAFTSSHTENTANLQNMRKSLARFETLSQADVMAILEANAITRPGAQPTAEQDGSAIIVPFRPGPSANGWEDLHHRAARDWALETLKGVTTFAADGSAIEPRGDLAVHVGVVQVGWFQNPHDPAQDYVKDVAVDVLLPDELHESEDAGSIEINWRRYQMETQKAIDFMRAHQGQRAVCFADGTLTISFVKMLRDARQQEYRDCVVELLDVSEATGVPVIGYVDYSRAIDLVNLVMCARQGHKVTQEEVRSRQITDAGLLNSLRQPAPPREPLMRWGDRSWAFICERDDGLYAPEDGEAANAYYDRVCFTYLKTSREGSPARLEVPRWVLERGPAYFEWVVDVARAECVVGVGYPYPLETADATAVLTMEDRQRFYQMFHEFARQQGLPVRPSRKTISKMRRR